MKKPKPTTAITITPRAALEAHASVADMGQRIMTAMKDRYSPLTWTAYQNDLERFGEAVGARTHNAALALLIGDGAGLPAKTALRSNDLVTQYIQALLRDGVSGATVNRRLAGLKAMVWLCKSLGIIEWELSVKGVRTKGYKDTRGPTKDQIQKILRAAATLKSKRCPGIDKKYTAMIWCMLAFLRRAEVCSIKYPSGVDLVDGRIMILGKGQVDEEWVAIPTQAVDAIRAWLVVRGTGEGYLFPGYRSRPLIPASVNKAMVMVSKKAGVKFHPHGFRHSGITMGLNLTKGDKRAVMRQSRHQSSAILDVYDDNRRDDGRDVAQRVADDLMK